MTSLQPRHTIGLLIPHLGGVYNGNVITGAYQAARRHDARLLVLQESPRRVAETRLAWEHVDGWIVALNVDGVELLAADGAPVVTLSNGMPGVVSVRPDNRSGMHAAVAHLIDHGHRQIAFIGRMANRDVAERFQGYCAALAQAGLPFDERLVVVIDSELVADGSQAARLLLELGVDFSAIAAGTDMNALGAIKVLRAAGRRIPEDCAVVGFDDISMAQVADPPLTTVRQRFTDLAGIAVERLLAQLADPGLPPEPITVPAPLITRRSCGCSVAPTPAHVERQRPESQMVWAAALTQRLVEQLTPLHIGATEAEQGAVWQHLSTIVDMVERAILNQPAQPQTALETAWSGLIALVSDVRVLHDLTALIEQTSLQRLGEQPTDPSVRTRTAAALHSMRGTLFEVRVAHEHAQTRALDAVLYSNNEVSTAMLNQSGGALGLGWLRLSPAQWGCLGLWDDPTSPSQLLLTSCYVRAGCTAPALVAQQPATAFPPIASLAAAVPSCTDLITLVPLRTAQRFWGILALDMQIDTSLSWNSDPVSLWSNLLVAALERNALLTNLATQQQSLLEMYRREQVLVANLRASEEQLRHSALHDALTGLPNRRLLLERLDEAILRARRNPSHLFALLFLDLNDFKTINDNLGHQIGDRLLVGIAQGLRGLVDCDDLVARLGGDEFVVLLDTVADTREATLAARRIDQALREPFLLGGQEICASASIGIALGAGHYEQPHDLLREADSAMYRVKGRAARRSGTASLRTVIHAGANGHAPTTDPLLP